MAPLQNAGTFLIQTLFDLYLFVLLLRFILQYLRVDYYNPLTQFVVKATNPLVVPLRRFIPGYWGLDLATVVLIVAFTFLKIILVSILGAHRFPALIGLLLWALGDITRLTLNLFFYATLLKVILSWIAPLSQSPVNAVIYRLTEPMMSRARRFIPPIAGFDVSPVLILIGLQLVMMLLADPLTQKGLYLAIR